MRGTPAPSWSLVGGLIGSAVIVAALLSTVVLVFAELVYGVSLPGQPRPADHRDDPLASLVFCALGIAISSLIPNMDSGPAIINLPFFILVFISGTYFPVTGNLAKIAGYFPLRPFITAMYHSFDPYATRQRCGPGTTCATWRSGASSASSFAVRHFRWLPSKP